MKRLNRLFTKMDQEYFICKSHLDDCETPEQVYTVGEWLGNVAVKWNNEFHMITDGLKEKKRVLFTQEFNDRIKSMDDEYDDLVNDKMSELTEPEHPIYKDNYHYKKYL